MAIDFTWVKNAAMRETVWQEYRRIRDAMQEDVVENVRAEFFAKYDMPRTARRLGIDVSVDESSGKSRIDLDNEQQLDILFDYAQMFDDASGHPLRVDFVSRYRDSSDESLRTLAEFCADYHYAWLRPLQVKLGFGVRCENILTHTECFVVDRGFSQTFEMRRNLGMFTGLHPFADPKLCCVMTGGAGLPVPLKDIESVLEKLLKALKIKKRPPLELSEEELARFVAASINQAFRAGSSEIIRYE